MEADDDMFVVIIADEEVKTEEMLDELLEEKTEVIVKPELEEDFECEYLQDVEFLEELENMKSEPDDVKSEIDDNDIESLHSVQYTKDIDDIVKVESESIDSSDDQKRKCPKPTKYKSFVAELRSQYPELRKDVNLLVNTLAEVMRNVKLPPLPKKFCEEDALKFECIHCKYVTPTYAAAGRHWQERHGTRYLICYACGMVFRCTLYLYRHEKRCKAPDAEVVLRARAKSIGSKARGRPFIENTVPLQKLKPVHCYSCDECSATFSTKLALVAHENLHKGLRPHRCDICPNAYTSPHALYRHMKIHKNAVFICDHCRKSFRMKNTLIEHMNTHRATKRFRCEECGHPFAHKAAMVRHIDKVHKNLPPPCVCDVCNKRYMRMSGLKLHMKKAHGMTLMSRNMFQKALPRMSDTEVLTMLALQES